MDENRFEVKGYVKCPACGKKHRVVKVVHEWDIPAIAKAIKNGGLESMRKMLDLWEQWADEQLKEEIENVKTDEHIGSDV